jgi:hypothetical protein
VAGTTTGELGSLLLDGTYVITETGIVYYGVGLTTTIGVGTTTTGDGVGAKTYCGVTYLTGVGVGT